MMTTMSFGTTAMWLPGVGGHANGGMLLLFAALVGVAAISGIAYLRGRIVAVSPAAAGLFEELSFAHGLSDEDRALLTRAAAGAAQRAVGFVDPRLLDRLATVCPRDAEACGRLRERLFGPAGC